MTVSPRHATLATKLAKMSADIEKRIGEFYTILEEIKTTTLPQVSDKIYDYTHEENDSKAEALGRDIIDNMRAISKNNFEIQKYARRLIDLGEDLQRAAEQHRIYNIGEIDQHMYRAKLKRSGEKW